jgi:hypothetical protein
MTWKPGERSSNERAGRHLRPPDTPLLNLSIPQMGISRR